MSDAKNSQAVKGLARNIGIMSAGRLVADVFTFLFYVALSREYGATALGHYAIAMALTGFGTYFSDFGLHPLTLKELGKDPQSIGYFGPRIIGLRLVMSILTYAAIALLAVPLIDDAQLLSAILLIGLFQIVWHFGMGLGGVFTAMGESQLNSLLEIGQRMIMAGGGIIAIASGATFSQTLWVMPGASFMHAGLAVFLVSKQYKLSSPKLDSSFASSVLRRSVSFAQANLLFRLQSRIDVLAVGFFVGSAAAGLYNAAHRIIFLIGEIVTHGGFALLPAAAHIAKEDMSRFRTFVRDIGGWALIIGIPLSVGIAFTSTDTILFLYGEEFRNAGYIMTLLSPMGLIMLLRQVFTSGLQALDLERQWARFWAVSTVLTVAAMAVMVPWMGTAGAAIGIVLTQAILITQCGIAMHRAEATPIDNGALMIAMLGSVTMCGCLWMSSSLPLIVKIGFALVSYLGTLAALPSARSRYLKPALRQMWPSRT